MPKQNHNFFLLAGRLICLAALSTIASHAQTTVFKLHNGDRITGVIISENTNQVALSNSWAKEIIIPLEKILSRETLAEPPTVTNAPVVVESAPAPAPITVPPPKPVIKPKKQKDWHGEIQVGADVGISEIERELYYSKFKITYAPVEAGTPTGASKFIGRFRNTFDYNAAYGTVTSDRTIQTSTRTNTFSETRLSANRMDGSSKTDFDLGADRKIFVYNLMGAGYDEIRRIEYRYELGPGVGYHLITRSNLNLNTEVGMNYQVQQFWKKGPKSLAHDRTYDESKNFYYRFAEDFSWKISKKLTFDEKFELFPQVDFSEYRFRFESNLRYWLWEYLSFNLTVLDIYDTRSAPNVGKNDLQVRSSIGVKF